MADVVVKVGVDMTAIDAAQARVDALKAEASRIGVGLPGGVVISPTHTRAGFSVAGTGTAFLSQVTANSIAAANSAADGNQVAARIEERKAIEHIGVPLLAGPPQEATLPDERGRFARRMVNEDLPGARGLIKSNENPLGWPMKALKNRVLYPDTQWMGAPGLEEAGGGRWYSRIPGSSSFIAEQPGVVVPQRTLTLPPTFLADMHRPYTAAANVNPTRSLAVPKETFLGQELAALKVGRIPGVKTIGVLAAIQFAKQVSLNYEHEVLADPSRTPTAAAWSAISNTLADFAVKPVEIGVNALLGILQFSGVVAAALGDRSAKDHISFISGARKGFDRYVNQNRNNQRANAAARKEFIDFSGKSAKWNEAFNEALETQDREIDERVDAFVKRVQESGLGFSPEDIDRSVRNLVADAVRNRVADEFERIRPKPNLRSAAQSGSFN